MSRAVMQQALEALVAAYQGKDKTGQVTEAITALKQALSEPEQEPVAYFDPQEKGFYWAKPTAIKAPMTVSIEPLPLYSAPTPKPEQKGWFTIPELNEWATKLPQTTHWEGCEAVHPECRKPEQEPIGHADLGINNIYIFNELEPRAVPAGRTPLYTAPAPQHDTDCHLQGICQRSGYSIAPTPRKPLSEYEMYAVEEEARKKFRLSQHGPRGQQITYWDGLTPWLIRAVERAHGIGEQHE